MRALFALAVVLIVFATSLPAQAHKPSDSYLTLTLSDAGASGRWDIALRDLDHVIGLDLDQDGALTWGEVRANHQAIAAYASDEVRDQLLSGAAERFTDATITRREDVLNELEVTRRRGYALCAEEIDEGVVSIAVPVVIEPVGVMFSLGVVGPARRMAERKLGELAATLKLASVQAGTAIQHFEGRLSESAIEGTELRASA